MSCGSRLPRSHAVDLSGLSALNVILDEFNAVVDDDELVLRERHTCESDFSDFSAGLRARPDAAHCGELLSFFDSAVCQPSESL